MSWNADVICSKTVGFGVEWAQHRLSNTQGMRWKSQEGMSPGLRLPRGPPVTLWLPSHCCQHETASRSLQHFTTHSPQTRPIYSCPHRFQRLHWKQNADSDISQTCLLHVYSADQQHTQTTPTRVSGGTKNKHKYTNPPFFWKPTTVGSCCTRDWSFCQH